MRLIDSHGLQERIIKVASQMDCENNSLAKQGKASVEVNKDIFRLIFIHNFLPYWNTEQVRQKECLLNDEYGV